MDFWHALSLVEAILSRSHEHYVLVQISMVNLVIEKKKLS